jgi:thymidylate kinase
MNLDKHKKIIILEGIATSGKTTLKDKLVSYFTENNHKVSVIGEDETLMPILHSTEKSVAIELLSKVIKKVVSDDSEVIIFDRLYFTHLFRTHSNTQDFSDIINLLSECNVLIVLLTVEKTSIGNRIFQTMKLRGSGWTEYVKKKGTDEEIIDYYVNQQEKLIELVQESQLQTLTFDTTHGDYDEIKNKIVEKIK